MCRVLSYLGAPVLVEDLLYNPHNSLIKQSHSPRFMHDYQNLAGFGMVAWDAATHAASKPFFYKTKELPFYDENLHWLSRKLRAQCLLGHVRGVALGDQAIITHENAHPFLFENVPLALAHNGSLVGLDAIKTGLIHHMQADIVSQIRGSTDSEWMYALIVSQLDLERNPTPSLQDTKEAVLNSLRIIRRLRQEHKIEIASPINLFITNGEFILATRFVFDFGRFPVHFSKLHLAYHSMWYTFGEEYGVFNETYQAHGLAKRNCAIIASEPLTGDNTMWVEVPEYSMISASYKDDEIHIATENIDI